MQAEDDFRNNTRSMRFRASSMVIQNPIQTAKNFQLNLFHSLQTVTNSRKGDAIFGTGYGTVGALSPAKSEREPSSNKKIDQFIHNATSH